jgi:hypothetical protein
LAQCVGVSRQPPPPDGSGFSCLSFLKVIAAVALSFLSFLSTYFKVYLINVAAFALPLVALSAYATDVCSEFVNPPANQKLKVADPHWSLEVSLQLLNGRFVSGNVDYIIENIGVKQANDKTYR